MIRRILRGDALTGWRCISRKIACFWAHDAVVGVARARGSRICKGVHMSKFFDSLESRTFLSAVPAVVTLHTDEAAVKTALMALKTAGSMAVKTINGDLKVADLQKTDKAQVKALSSALATLIADNSKAISAAAGKVNGDVAKLLAAEAQLAKKSSTKLMMKVSTDMTNLTTDATAALSAITTANSGTAVESALSAIISDGGTEGSDASSAMTTLGTDDSTFSTAATQAYSTDVTAILAL